ncbi:Xylose isomerase domain protein TIM barrel [Beutenbergia cavernae DSM 12333]|uniref:Xylose isomerase domain protein TIM barrel n=1 Tax=Beutenbergia cavernae (strain ATCC BAA-8 / DSM 12333 / CCUG 43141 / JCM 11478 / NBRC 16432 / NCIMB 13614 / HKI 0122) TaxID=471853 RepID=C5C3A3_BEUC1|nr:sugar phosphate isomerase/epimerase family protein [Beutenbergia cavernae]ACQ79802.1 Xylose isomerase domain protein TIM barrel [Beutenbergia cavernae DSM 12333]
MSAPTHTTTSPDHDTRPRAEDWPIGAALLQFPGGAALTQAGPPAWRPALREVALAGFSHVDLTDSWVRPGDLDPAGLRALTGAAAELGLAFSAISVTRQSVIDPDPDVAAANLDYALRSVDAAAALGVGVLCLGLHRPLTSEQQQAQWFWHARGAEDPDDEAVYALAVERFSAIGERAAAAGVQISLEMYEGTYLGTSAGAVRLAGDIGLANVGLCPDIGNIVRLHRPVEDWRVMLERMLPVTNYWQVKNYLRDHDPATGAYFSAPAPLESGFIDYRTAIGMAVEAGFSGPLCVEHYGGDGLSVAASNREYLRRVLRAKLGE